MHPNSRLQSKIRDPNPCHGCTRPEKRPGCHDNCDDRKAWREELRRVDAARKAYKARNGF